MVARIGLGEAAHPLRQFLAWRRAETRWPRVAWPVTPEPATARPLRIGVVLHDFGLGGTERIAVRLSGAWARAGARVTIFCGTTEGPLAALLDRSVELVAASPSITRARGSRRRLGEAAAAHWMANPVDVLFVPGNFHWETVPATTRLAAAVRPAVVAQISASLDKPQRGRLRQFAFDLRMRRLLRDVDATVALFDQAREVADRIMGVRRAETIALPALVDDVAAPRAPSSGRMIVAAGRLVPEKGFSDLVDAFALLDDPTASLVILGAGPERASLRARAMARGVGDRLVLPGYVEDIRPWLDAARLFVLPSRFEGYPAVLVEALGAGRPVVATRCTAAIDLLVDTPETGTIVPIADPAALARAMAARLAAPAPDPGALASRVARHRIGPVAEAYLSLFERVSLARKRASA